ncbi:uncharacterized protein L969DRAFT_359949 [Mixia osmundae IAM 14324]|uniref:uncharacterized protein n=1 Tax=Mixia osmundae (strain CBS 9802 / IAM 14324 / JCM 22182 / KY 12970) TaxID=764103 RepID=UPI0004A5569B|nr:uncharacterized protein L969DRAFT_359949 [Mixia osmundae IAM 14324]KEI40870.1 hypothetical protein L969DRAFT_359949 [Mixia osmundae IAM 14324]
MDLDADLIPSLSLPPPIMPLRIYGHNYLDKKALVQVSLGHPNTSKASILSPVRLYNQSQLSSLKLVISSKPDSMAIPHSVILPLTDEREVFSFQIESFDVLSLEFDLFPTFGSKVIGKAVAFPSTFSDLQSQGHYVIPLLDPHLKVIGEIAFEVNVVKPFEGVQLEVGGRMETYWKSTNPVTAPDTGLMPAPLGLNPGPAGSSVVTASSLTGEHVRIVVQVTNDGVPVVYPSWNLPIDGFELRVSDISFAQFEALAVRKGKTLASKITAKTQEPSEWYRAISESLVGLSEVLAVTPTSRDGDQQLCRRNPQDCLRDTQCSLRIHCEAPAHRLFQLQSCRLYSAKLEAAKLCCVLRFLLRSLTIKFGRQSSAC